MSYEQNPKQPPEAKRDHRQEVTDSIIKMLEDGVAPWQKPWESAGLPMNPTSGREYRGGNAVHLMATGLSRGYEDPRWMTYKQAADNGWQVRQGEKGTRIEFWEVKSNTEKSGDQENADLEKAEGKTNRLIHRIYTVFNAKQIDGVPAHEPTTRSPFEVVQSCERILANSGASIAHDQRDSAFYNRRSDSIHLPPKDAFKDAQGYYGTALHELAHWTGHPSRLNRTTLTDSYRFGDVNYAREELRAELASVFIAAETGVPHEPAKHAAYVGHWIKALKDDKNEIFRAAHDASGASDYVLNLEREVSKARSAEMTDGVSVDRLRNETEALENDRDGLSSSSGQSASERTPDSEGRESSRFVARLESPTGTVAVHDKQGGTDCHNPIESSCASTSISGGERSGRDALDGSFSGAKDITAAKLGESARTFAAQTQSGNYRGEIIGETDLHVLQRISSQSAVAHVKQLLEPVPHVGERATIAYANERASVKEWRERSRTQELTR